MAEVLRHAHASAAAAAAAALECVEHAAAAAALLQMKQAVTGAAAAAAYTPLPLLAAHNVQNELQPFQTSPSVNRASDGAGAGCRQGSSCCNEFHAAMARPGASWWSLPAGLTVQDAVTRVLGHIASREIQLR